MAQPFRPLKQQQLIMFGLGLPRRLGPNPEPGDALNAPGYAGRRGAELMGERQAPFLQQDKVAPSKWIRERDKRWFGDFVQGSFPSCSQKRQERETAAATPAAPRGMLPNLAVICPLISFWGKTVPKKPTSHAGDPARRATSAGPVTPRQPCFLPVCRERAGRS